MSCGLIKGATGAVGDVRPVCSERWLVAVNRVVRLRVEDLRVLIGVKRVVGAEGIGRGPKELLALYKSPTPTPHAYLFLEAWGGTPDAGGGPRVGVADPGAVPGRRQ